MHRKALLTVPKVIRRVMEIDMSIFDISMSIKLYIICTYVNGDCDDVECSYM